MKITRSAITKAALGVLETGAKRATVYLDEKTVVSCAARHKPDKRSKRVEVVIKAGAPNYAERQFIADCRKAGEPLPVRKVQLKWWPKK